MPRENSTKFVTLHLKLIINNNNNSQHLLPFGEPQFARIGEKERSPCYGYGVFMQSLTHARDLLAFVF